MKRKRLGNILLTLGATAGVLGCREVPQHTETAAHYAVTSPLKRDTEITSEYVCQIYAIRHIELRALERGYLQGIFVDEGQLVKKGQPMFQIMPILYQAELRKAAAEAEFANIEFDNTKSLAERNVVSGKELSLAQAKLDKANAEVALASAHLNLTEVKAPFDGIMDRLQVRQGSLVDEGELLTTLSDNQTMWVYYNVTEAEYLDYKSKIDGGGPTTVQLRMANDQIFDQVGTLETIEADFNNETGNIEFRAAFPNPKGLLRHGETGTVLMTTPLTDALLIPQKATFEVLDKKFVYVLGDDNVVRSREIEVAEELPHLYVVADGLEETDQILLEGLNRVRDGDSLIPAYQEPAEVLSRLDLPAE